MQIIKFIRKMPWYGIVGIILFVAGCTSTLIWMNKDNHIGFVINQRIDITPTQIESIRRIGEWEFLSVRDEELIDTIDHGFIKDSELVRIYYGTVRLGIDMRKAKGKWITIKGDSVVAILPPIEILDSAFIDEARTRSFYESGSWKAADRESLYNRAWQKMYNRAMSPENITTAEENAREQFRLFLQSMGFKRVRVEVEKSHNFNQ